MKQHIHNGQLVTGLMEAMHDGERTLNDIPMLVKTIIREDMWREFYVDRTKQLVTHTRFADFVAAQPMKGLGADVALLRRICTGDNEAIDLIDKVEKRKRGNPTGANQHRRGNRKNLPISSPKKRDRSTQHLRQIRKDFPDIHKDVVDGKTSVGVAAIQAGIQARRVSINLQSPTSAARTIER